MKSLGVRLFDVTGSHRSETEQHFERAGIADCFEFVITAEDVENHKPHPESYLKALKKLNELPGIEITDPSGCFVTEDSEGGVMSAKKAGFSVIGITNTTDAQSLWKAGADIVVNKINARLYENIIGINKQFDSHSELITSIFTTYGELSTYVNRWDRKYYSDYIKGSANLSRPSSFFKDVLDIIANRCIPAMP